MLEREGSLAKNPTGENGVLDDARKVIAEKVQAWVLYGVSHGGNPKARKKGEHLLPGRNSSKAPPTLTMGGRMTEEMRRQRKGPTRDGSGISQKEH